MPKEITTAGITNNKDVTDTANVITKHTIDNITYTIKARSSETAKLTLQQKLEATIARDIVKISAN